MPEYKKQKVRIQGNRKTNNAVDVVRGCVGAQKKKNGCYHSCYACRMSKISLRDFHVPVENELDEDLFLRDLQQNKETWIRVGTNGDPSICWETTTRTCELISYAGKTPVVMTKAWKQPTNKQLKRLANAGAQLQIGVSAMDTKQEEESRLKLAKNYKRLAGYEKTIMRFATTAWKKDTYKHQKQEQLFRKYSKSFRIVEGPLRLFSTIPYWDDIDQTKLSKHISAFSGKEDSQKHAGLIFADRYSDYNHNQRSNGNGSYITCHEITCDKCQHKCGTVK